MGSFEGQPSAMTPGIISVPADQAAVTLSRCARCGADGAMLIAVLERGYVAGAPLPVRCLQCSTRYVFVEAA